MGWLSDQFKDMSIKGQAKNPLQILVNPMAIGTVGIAQLKDQDNKTGWFSNLFKGGGNLFKGGNSNTTPYNTKVTPAASPDPNQKYYIIAGVVIFIIVLFMIMRKPNAGTA